MVLLPTLSFVAYFLACVWHDRPFCTRATPAEIIRIAAGVAFAGWVHPALGLLALVSAGWWFWWGFRRAQGGLLWPTIAMMWWLGQHAPTGALQATLVMFLVVGIFQVAVAWIQRGGIRLFPFPGYPVHGTIGHRTGFGIYLALLIPLGFFTDYGWWLTLIYVSGIVLAQSSVAASAAWVGLVVVHPGLAWTILLVPLIAAGRLVERQAPGTDLRGQWHLGPWCLKPIAWSPPGRPRDDPWALRWGIWTSTWARCWSWPHWLIGHGPTAFRQDATHWTQTDQLREAYHEAHNDYLELWYDYGAVGFLCFAWLVVSVGVGMTMGPALGTLAALALAMLANFPLSVTPLVTLGFFALLLGMIR